MGFWDNVQGVYHQANPFDGGRTYDTNSRGVNPGTPVAVAAPSSPQVIQQKPMVGSWDNNGVAMYGDGVVYNGDGYDYSGTGNVAAAAPAPPPPMYDDGFGGKHASQAEAQRIGNARRTGQLNNDKAYTTGNQNFKDSGATYATNNQNFVNDIRTGQNDINSGRTNNALNLRRSMATIASGVRQGMRSGAVGLANMNALDSSASQALAMAYARAGNGQRNDASNQYQLTENEFQSDQATMDANEKQTLANFQTWRGDETSRYDSELNQALASIGVDYANAGLDPNLVDKGRVGQVVQDGKNRYDAIDAQTAAELGIINPLTQQELEAAAYAQDIAGAPGVSPFQVDTIGVNSGRPGADNSQIDFLYTRRNKDRK